jgi:hypothetical protein
VQLRHGVSLDHHSSSLATPPATAARTCKAWLGPALRHLYRAIDLDAYDMTLKDRRYILSADIVARIGHGVRNLALSDGSGLSGDAYGLDAALVHFAHLTLLSVNAGTAQTGAEENPRISAILSCPSLPNLANLDVFFGTSRPAFPFSTVLKACRNLRRLRFNPTYNLSDHPLELDAPERLEDLTIYQGHMHETLAPIFAWCTHLTTLNLHLLRGTDYGLVEQIIRGSSQSLQSISLCDFDGEESDGEADGGRLLLRALPCTSVRFLQLGWPIVGSIQLRQLFGYLASLPVEFLSLLSPISSWDGLIDCLPLLPSALAINVAFFRRRTPVHQIEMRLRGIRSPPLNSRGLATFLRKSLTPEPGNIQAPPLSYVVVCCILIGTS